MENRSIVVPTLWLLLRHHFSAILHSEQLLKMAPKIVEYSIEKVMSR